LLWKTVPDPYSGDLLFWRQKVILSGEGPQPLHKPHPSTPAAPRPLLTEILNTPPHSTSEPNSQFLTTHRCQSSRQRTAEQYRMAVIFEKVLQRYHRRPSTSAAFLLPTTRTKSSHSRDHWKVSVRPTS